jgi:hypothetical protein
MTYSEMWDNAALFDETLNTPSGRRRAACPVCGSLGSSLQVQVGRGEYFPDAVASLIPYRIDRDQDVLCCPECGALFHWNDQPQFYGSGNLDAETLMLLTDVEAAAVRALLSIGMESPVSAADILSRAFDFVDRKLVGAILRHLLTSGIDPGKAFIDVVIDRLIQTNDSGLVDGLTIYCGSNPERAISVVERIKADPRPKGQYVQSALLQLSRFLQPIGEEGRGER